MQHDAAGVQERNVRSGKRWWVLEKLFSQLSQQRWTASTRQLTHINCMQPRKCATDRTKDIFWRKNKKKGKRKDIKINPSMGTLADIWGI